MGKILYFKPKSQQTIENNLIDFIALARDKIKLWDSNGDFSWDSYRFITHSKAIRFHNLKSRNIHHSRPLLPENLMSSPYIDFSKAYIRYTQNIQQTHTFTRTYAALMLIETSLIEIDNKADITILSPRHLDRACEILDIEGFKDRQGIGNAMTKIASDVGRWHLTNGPTKYWKHPFVKENINQSVLGIKENAKNKLPNDDALFAIAEVFGDGYRNELDDSDTYITSVTALLLSAPHRINELNLFRTDALKTEKDRDGNKQIYLHMHAPKVSQYDTKPIPKTMAGHAKSAFARLLNITEDGRRLAKHLESGSNDFFLHDRLPDIPANKILTKEQLVDALAQDSKKSAETLIHTLTGQYRLRKWTLDSLWDVIRQRNFELCPHFPYQRDPADHALDKPLRMSESLICLRYRQVAADQKMNPLILVPANPDYYTKRIAGREKIRSNGTISNINFFLKHGYDDILLKSHECRHFLNTLAQESGVSIDVITEWSTRASVAQSRTYMHQDPDRKAKLIYEELNPEEELTERIPITEEDYSLIDKGPVITTRYGICTHNYTISPCQKHGDCLNCSDQLLCKGHKRSIREIQKEHDRVRENLQATQEEIDAGRKSANRWYDSHLFYLERLSDLLRIMTDPSIEDGSPIQMKGKDFNHHDRITEKRSINILKKARFEEVSSDTYSDDIKECLQLLMDE